MADHSFGSGTLAPKPLLCPVLGKVRKPEIRNCVPWDSTSRPQYIEDRCPYPTKPLGLWDLGTSLFYTVRLVFPMSRFTTSLPPHFGRVASSSPSTSPCPASIRLRSNHHRSAGLMAPVTLHHLPGTRTPAHGAPLGDYVTRDHLVTRHLAFGSRMLRPQPPDTCRYTWLRPLALVPPTPA